MVGCAKPMSFTKSPQTQVSSFIINSKIAILAGCPNTFAMEAISFCSSVKNSDLVNPTFIYLFIYCNITINKQKNKGRLPFIKIVEAKNKKTFTKGRLKLFNTLQFYLYLFWLKSNKYPTDRLK